MYVCFIKKRYIVTLLATLGTCILITMERNLGVTIVDITSSKNVTTVNVTYEAKPEFTWSSVEKGLILSISAYGALLSPLGGFLASKIGGATVFGTGIAINGILSIITPPTIRLNIIYFILVRLFEGICQGFIGASLMEVFIHWTPPNERSRLIVSGICGCYIGSTIAHSISGFIIKNYGWEAVFFITGGSAMVWYMIWVVLVRNTPNEDKFISKAERSFLMEKIQLAPKTEVVYPWKSILTSKPVWALLNEFFTLAWSYSFIINNLPLYISDVQHVDIESIGLLSSIPSLCSLIGLLVAAFISDYLRSRYVANTHTIHKIFISFGQISAIILLIITGLWMDFKGSIICFSVLRFCCSFAETSYEVLPSDLAVQYASVIRGMSLTMMNIGFILSPTIMGFMVSDHSRTSWNRYILFLSIFNIWSLVIFLIFGSAKPQPWAEPAEGKNVQNKRSEKNTNF